MAKRPYGTGYLKEKGGKWIIRWRETEIGPDGKKRRVLRYENLGSITKKDARRILSERMGKAEEPTRSRVSFAKLAAKWEQSVAPLYKHSTQKNHLHILTKHLTPRFSQFELSELTPPLLQDYIADLQARGYAPKTIDHIHDVFSSILRTGVEWGYLQTNPASHLKLPELRTVRPKWALTPAQSIKLLGKLQGMARTMVALDVLTGLSRAELFALRRRCYEPQDRSLTITETVYEGQFGTTKTSARTRRIPLSEPAAGLLERWLQQGKRKESDALIFATRSGKPISPNNVLRRWVFPACDELGVPRATWLTFRRTYASWAHDKGIPDKVLAALMGHANVRTTLNVYTQVMTDSVRAATAKVGEELFKIVH